MFWDMENSCKQQELLINPQILGNRMASVTLPGWAVGESRWDVLGWGWLQGSACRREQVAEPMEG